MSGSACRRIALLGMIPVDIRTSLAKEFDLLDAGALGRLTAAERATITHCLTSAMSGIESDALDSLPGIRRIASVGAGMDLFDLPALTARSVDVCPTPDVMTEDTAEYAVALVFAVLRNVVSNDRFVRRGNWAEGRAPLGWRVSGRKVGIVGLGRIGGRVAEKLGALQCDVAYTARGSKDVPWRFESDVVALAQSVDVLVLCCAGGDATRGLIDADVLRSLGPEAFLVNVSRGSVVDETALLSALETGGIAGAALDVFEGEPRPDPRFLDLQNCILSPHAAVFTHENRADLIAEIRRLLTS